MQKHILFFVLLFAYTLNGWSQIRQKSLDLTYLQELRKRTHIPNSYSHISSRTMAPIIEGKEINLRSSQDIFRINYIDILDSGHLQKLADTLDNANYPLTVLHKDVFSAYTELLLEYDALVFQYTGLEQTCDTLTALREREIHSLKNIIQLEKERAEIMRTSRDDLMVQVGHLNQQLSESIKVKKKSSKRNFGKNFLMAIVGGAVGFATGVIIMEFAN